MSYLLLAAGGIFIGLVVAAPIGPVNLICIRRTLHYGSLNGFLSGLGAALGDGVFACVTGFGLTAVAQWIEGYATPLRVIGGIMLIFFGIHNYRAPVAVPNGNGGTDSGSSSLFSAVASTFALTITNPATLFGFAALFAGLGGVTGDRAASFLAATATVGGVILGSAGWWAVITMITGVFHRRIDKSVMRRINQISGIAVAGFGIVVLGQFVWSLIRADVPF